MHAPGSGAGYFTWFNNGSIGYNSSQMIAFAAQDSIRGWGLYVNRGGSLEDIAVDGCAAPGGGTFDMENVGFSTDAGHVAFASYFSDGHAIYTDAYGSLERVIATGDTLFGQQVSDVQMDVEGFSNNQIAFWAKFTDGTSGIYVAAVPEPCTLVLLSLGAILLRRPLLRAV
jgi:hypothetical protein